MAVIYERVSRETLIAQMRESAAHFAYRKVDGSSRFAFGSLNPELIDYVMASRSSSPRKRTSFSRDEEMISYFDLEANNWRSFRADNLIGMDLDYSL